MMCNITAAYKTNTRRGISFFVLLCYNDKTERIGVSAMIGKNRPMMAVKEAQRWANF